MAKDDKKIDAPVTTPDPVPTPVVVVPDPTPAPVPAPVAKKEKAAAPAPVVVPDPTPTVLVTPVVPAVANQDTCSVCPHPALSHYVSVLGVHREYQCMDLDATTGQQCACTSNPEE